MSRQERLRNRFVAVLAAFLLIAAGVFGYLQPHLASTRQSARDAQNAILDLNNRLREVLAQKERNKVSRAKFTQLRREGFLDAQDRLRAAEIIEELRIRHAITSLDYQIDPVSSAIIISPQDPKGLDLRESKITLNLRGFLDRDMNGFLRGLLHSMPGHLTVRSMEITKLATPDQKLLARIARGEDAALVSGEVELAWQVLQEPMPDAPP